NYSSSDLVPGKWVDLAVVRSGNTFKLLINGVLQEPVIVIDPHDSDLPQDTNFLRLGRRSDDKKVSYQTAQFYGLIDDVGGFNRALSLAELKQLRDHSLDGTESGLIAGYNFDDNPDAPRVLKTSSIVFKSATAKMRPSGITLVSRNRNDAVDKYLLPLPFQQT